MRAWLNRLYDWSGYLAAAFLAAIGVTTIAQVVAREMGLTLETTELAGFCLAASSFLGLAHTFRNGTHVRVNLLIRRFAGPNRRWVEFWCCGAAALAVGFLAVQFGLFAWESHVYGDVSPGLLAIPFWIPQSGVVLGLTCLTIALADEAVAVLQGRTPVYENAVDAALE